MAGSKERGKVMGELTDVMRKRAEVLRGEGNENRALDLEEYAGQIDGIMNGNTLYNGRNLQETLADLADYARKAADAA